MKHIKRFFENIDDDDIDIGDKLKEYFQDKINWTLVNKIQDLLSDFLDQNENYKLHIAVSVFDTDDKYRFFNVWSETFRYMTFEKFETIKKSYEKDGLVYIFHLSDITSHSSEVTDDVFEVMNNTFGKIKKVCNVELLPETNRIIRFVEKK